MLLGVAVLFLVARLGGAADPASSAAASAPSPLGPPLEHAPLAPPIVFNGGFGDLRGGHFHAGFDLGTNHRVGRAVLAPAAGWIERIRASGVGYGRSLYLHASDGRLFVFGHLDAFAARLDAYVRRVQDSTGVYEQDLWPSRSALPVRAGETIAWSGESGAGGPHLHFEIRRGDIAYNPQRAGFAVADRRRPALGALTLEPLDDRSAVAGRAGPYTVNLSDAGPDTLRALGRLRAVVIARDRLRPGSALVTPWSVAIEWEGRTTECRFDSVSWAGDMVEAEYVYDVGRVTGGRGIVLWAPPGFRPRVLRGDAPLAEEAGTIAIAPGDPPRTLRIRARDVAGNETSRRVVLLPGAAPAAAGPGWARAEPRWTGRSLEFTSLPGGFVRLSLATRRAPAGASFQVGDRAARGSRCADDWCATLALPESAALATVPLRIAWREKDDGGTAAGAAGFVLARRAGRGAEFTIEDVAWGARIDVPGGALFEDGALFAFGEDAGTAADLEPVGASWRIEPSNLPLRTPLTVRLRAPAGIALDRTGLYRYDGNGWAYVGSSVDSAAREVSAPSRSLGRFAIFRDTIPPRIAWIAPPQPSPAAKRGPYSRWAVEATVTERGSGVDARASWLEVDGARVPTEWDPEAKRLRWRPANPPAPGAHQVVVVAADRAGNVAREAGRFRIQP